MSTWMKSADMPDQQMYFYVYKTVTSPEVKISQQVVDVRFFQIC